MKESKSTNVDQAFQRLYGYAWDSSSKSKSAKQDDLPQELMDIFGSKRIVERILRLPPTVAGEKAVAASKVKDAAMLMTKRIAITGGNRKRRGTAVTTTINRQECSFKRIKLSAKDYKNIELPKDVIAARIAAVPEVSTTGTAPQAKTASATLKKKPPAGSKLDSVLQKIAGEKKQNTVEKTSNDWETFKEQDKQLQDELEIQAQSKDAYLVKQDFLNRVDQRRFEIEKEGRDQERSRRQLAQASAKK